MTIGSLKFVYHIDGDGANLQDSFDLLNFAQGFELAEGGWIQQIPAGDNVTLIETLNFRVMAHDQDDLAAIIQTLDTWITRVNYYQSKAMRVGVWLRASVAGETNPRQALVTALQYAISESAFGVLWADHQFIGNLTIVLERSAWWEEITPIQNDTLAASNYLSDTLGATVGGDYPARAFSLRCVAGGGATNRTSNTFYAGFKNDRYFDPVNFYPFRAFNAYVAGAGTDASIAGDPGVGVETMGTVLKVTFATSTALVTRHTLPMKYYTTDTSTVITLTNDYVSGEYIVLMRARCSVGATIRARIRVGYWEAPTADKYYPRVTIKNDGNYHLHEMGMITIPPQRVSGYESALTAGIKLDAELILLDPGDPRGTLYADGYILIPMDGAVRGYSDDGIISKPAGFDRHGYVEFGPSNEIAGYTIELDTNTIFDTVQVSPQKWQLPQTMNGADPAFVMAFDSDASQTRVTDNYVTVFKYFRRWRTLRGNE